MKTKNLREDAWIIQFIYKNSKKMWLDFWTAECLLFEPVHSAHTTLIHLLSRSCRELLRKESHMPNWKELKGR